VQDECSFVHHAVLQEGVQDRRHGVLAACAVPGGARCEQRLSNDEAASMIKQLSVEEQDQLRTLLHTARERAGEIPPSPPS
jgi:hypothetical protein